MPEREVMTGTVPFAVRGPRVRDRAGKGAERGRIDVEPAEAPPGPLGRKQRRSGAQKEIQHEIAVLGYILERIGNQPVGLTVGCKVRSSRRLPRMEFTEA
jgi:hypothetical protein